MAKVRLSGNARAYLGKEANISGTGKVGRPHSDMRCLVLGDYLMDYRVHGDEIRILDPSRVEVTIEPDDADYDDDDSTQLGSKR